MTTEHEARRTLVKSPPELWAECSDAGSLARHLGEFGEIRITKLEPETAIAWEAEWVSGTVQIEPSGWGTRVTLTAQVALEAAELAPAEAETAAPLEPEEASGLETAPEEDAGASDEVPNPEEENDATLEKTSEGPDLAVAADPAGPGGRPRRLRELIRRFLKGPEEVPADPTPSTVAPRPEPEGSIAPPAAGGEQATEGSIEAEAGSQPQPQTPGESGAEEVAEVERVSEPDPQTSAPVIDADAILTAALDSLGQAHHRPFSRA